MPYKLKHQAPLSGVFITHRSPPVRPLQNDGNLPLFSTNETANDTSNTSDLTQNTSNPAQNTSDFSILNEFTQGIEQLTARLFFDALYL